MTKWIDDVPGFPDGWVVRAVAVAILYRRCGEDPEVVGLPGEETLDLLVRSGAVASESVLSRQWYRAADLEALDADRLRRLCTVAVLRRMATGATERRCNRCAGSKRDPAEPRRECRLCGGTGQPQRVCPACGGYGGWHAAAAPRRLGDGTAETSGWTSCERCGVLGKE